MQHDSLLEKYLPEYTFSEYHYIVVNSSSLEEVYRLGREVNLGESKIIPLLLKARGLPTERLDAPGFLEAMNFSDIEQRAPYEALYGFLKTDRIHAVASYRDFVNDTVNAGLKVVFSFQYSKINAKQVKIETETRVRCIGIGTHISYFFYWIGIRYFSGMIRKEILRIIKRNAEK